jgi:hypothetical protein
VTTKRDHNPSQSVADIYACGRLFSIVTARDIVEAVGIPPLLDPDDHNPEIEASPEDMVSAQLARKLNDAAQWWAWNERQQTAASPAKRAERADQVAAKCAGLLASMRGPDGELLDSLGAGGLWAQAALGGADSGRDAVNSALSAIEELQGWALTMASRDGRHTRHTSDKGRPSDEAFKDLIGTLGGIFLMFWRRVPRLNRDPLNGGAPGGPFFLFVSAVLYEMDDARSDEAIATAIQRNPALKALRAIGE